MTLSTPVRRDVEGPVLRLSLDNPPANALSVEVLALLQAAIEGAREDASIRVVVIAACGKLFSAGHDLKEMTAHRGDPDAGRRFFERTFGLCSKLMQSIVTFPKPVIAAVDGIATAAGCQLVASCDLAVASRESMFGVNGIDVGLFCSTPAVALTRNVTIKRAMEMLLTGEMIDAATALDVGLLNRVVGKEELNEVVNAYARTIAAKSPAAVRFGKEALYQQAGLGLHEAYDLASRAMVENMLAADAKEGIGAFFERRQPRWLGS